MAQILNSRKVKHFNKIDGERRSAVVINDREMKLELASEAVGRGCPEMWVAK